MAIKNKTTTLDAELSSSSNEKIPVPNLQKEEGLHDDDNKPQSLTGIDSSKIVLDATAGSSKSTQNQKPTCSKNEPGEGELEDGEGVKLTCGVDTEDHPDKKAYICQDGVQMEGEGTDWTQNPWQYVNILWSNGYSIYWRLMKRQDWKTLAKEEQSRLFRCIVSYNNIQGICEASTSKQAKQGAAVDFLREMSKEFPLLAEKYAYKNLLKESGPTMEIHIGKEQCSGDQSQYFGVESEMMHSYDFSQASISHDAERENVPLSLATEE